MGSSPSDQDNKHLHWAMQLVRKELGKVGLEFLAPLIGKVLWDRRPERDEAQSLVAQILTKISEWRSAALDIGYRYLTKTVKNCVSSLHKSILSKKRTEAQKEKRRQVRKEAVDSVDEVNDGLVSKVKNELFSTDDQGGDTGGGNKTPNAGDTAELQQRVQWATGG